MRLLLKPQPTPTRFEPYDLIVANGAAFNVAGVMLGATGQTDIISIAPLSETPQCDEDEYEVPAHILEAALRGGAQLFRNINLLEDPSRPQWKKQATEATVLPACGLAPEGWKCTRQEGHDGPCAAVPIPFGKSPKRD